MIFPGVIGQQQLLTMGGGPSTPPEWITKGPFAAAAGLATASWPSSSEYEVGDLAVIFIGTPNEPLSVPAGWTQIVGISTGSGGVGLRLFAFWKIIDGTEASFTVGNAANSYTLTIIHIIRGAHATTPIDIYATRVGSAVNNQRCPAITTTGPNRLIIGAISGTVTAQTIASWSSGILTDLTSRSEDVTSVGADGTLGVVTGLKAGAGTTGDITVDMNWADIAVSMTVAIAPA